MLLLRWSAHGYPLIAITYDPVITIVHRHQQHDREKLNLLQDCSEGMALRRRMDVNNFWPDAVSTLPFFKALNVSCFALEEPLAVGRYDELAQLAQALNMRIILGESFFAHRTVRSHRRMPAHLDHQPSRFEKWAG